MFIYDMFFNLLIRSKYIRLEKVLYNSNIINNDCNMTMQYKPVLFKITV